MASNAIKDFHVSRKRRDRRVLFSSESAEAADQQGALTADSPEQEVEEQRAANELARLAAQVLPARRFQVFKLKFRDRLEDPAIALIMDISESAVRDHWSKAVRSLEQTLEHRHA